MVRLPVLSSNVAAVGHDAEFLGGPSDLSGAAREAEWAALGRPDAPIPVLEVEFKNGGIYRYWPVTVERHAKIMASDSIGTEIAKLKKDPDVQCVKVPAEAVS